MILGGTRSPTADGEARQEIKLGSGSNHTQEGVDDHKHRVSLVGVWYNLTSWQNRPSALTEMLQVSREINK